MGGWAPVAGTKNRGWRLVIFFWGASSHPTPSTGRDTHLSSPPPARAYRKRRARAHRRRPRRARSGIMPSMLTNLGCAGSAAVITVTGIHPIDTVKTRLQVSGTKGARNYAALGISGTVSTILKEEGPRQRPPTGVLARKREEIQPCRPRPHRVLEGDRGRLDARGVVHLISAGAVQASEVALQSRQAGRRVRRP